jgi:PAS domain S-box-containing protein
VIPGPVLPVPAILAWAQLIDALGDAAWLVDAAWGQVAAANRAAADLLGLPAEQLRGRLAEQLVATPEDMAFWDDVRASGGRAGGWLASHTVLVHASGRLVKVHRRIQALAEPGAEAPRFYLVTVQDRTEAERHSH